MGLWWQNLIILVLSGLVIIYFIRKSKGWLNEIVLMSKEHQKILAVSYFLIIFSLILSYIPLSITEWLFPSPPYLADVIPPLGVLFLLVIFGLTPYGFVLSGFLLQLKLKFDGIENSHTKHSNILIIVGQVPVILVSLFFIYIFLYIPVVSDVRIQEGEPLLLIIITLYLTTSILSITLARKRVKPKKLNYYLLFLIISFTFLPGMISNILFRL